MSMIEVDRPCPSATDGEIAAINLESACRRAWARFTQDARLAGLAAEFYAGSGNDCRRALELARANVANRPARRAVEQAHTMAVNADEAAAASRLHEACNARCGDNR
jgi:hypothetical protein